MPSGTITPSAPLVRADFGRAVPSPNDVVETSQRNVQGIRIENANASQGPLLRDIGFTTWKQCK